MNNNYDIIIIGAGLSGISLAIELSLRTDKTILILEKKDRLKKDKNWCFWSKPKNYFSDIVENRWDKIVIRAKGRKLVKEHSQHSYLRISSKKFYDEGLKIINKTKASKILFGQEIKKIKEFRDYIQVTTKKNTFYGKTLFNSMPKEISEKKLKQHFFGIEVTSEKPVFNRKEIILMDFQGKKDLVHFFYLLPYTNKNALIETTYFSNSIFGILHYKNDIRAYLKNNFPNERFRVDFCEKGILPMYKTESISTKRNIQIGTSNNWLKISTGYGFQKAFLNSAKIVDCILDNKRILIPKSRIGEILDKIFCEFLNKYPNDYEDFFFRFFSRLSLKTIINFLTEKYNILDLLKVLLVLPKKKLILTAISIFKKKAYYVD
tara:strand:+ start:303 stop:1433 length:1131 start_codon:yes stop_codon:yes gene_type:complete